jgi:hypothetical protein
MGRSSNGGGAWLLAALLCAGLVGCGGTRLIKQPAPFAVEKPLVTGSDERVALSIDWVIVRDGPGTWAANADWDQYLLSVSNLSDAPLSLRGVAVRDSLDTRLASTANHAKLVAGSRATVRRYRDSKLKVRAGVGGATLAAAGATALVAGEVYGLAALSGAVSATGATAGAVVGAMALAPVLVFGGMVRSYRTGKVAAEIAHRHTKLPLELPPGQTLALVVFFPLAPAPRQIELTYADDSVERVLSIDTRAVLLGLHLDAPAGNAP